MVYLTLCMYRLGCVHTEHDNNLSPNKITYKVNGKTHFDVLFITSSVSEKSLDIDTQNYFTLAPQVEIIELFKRLVALGQPTCMENVTLRCADAGCSGACNVQNSLWCLKHCKLIK